MTTDELLSDYESRSERTNNDVKREIEYLLGENPDWIEITIECDCPDQVLNRRVSIHRNESDSERDIPQQLSDFAHTHREHCNGDKFDISVFSMVTSTGVVSDETHEGMSDE